ncbi:metallophosphoesterase [Magnetospirillum sp. SS-4]|uniref:metallophosphoesterase n=1 Tax=Magnetospirillum sp. SS-4 TaxID=2681465 RepID=UPI001384EB5B|nr:metallophosphoesterase [Magnetospirillum sp. SS-4]CAA7627315.1 conserved hypothetical protein [Magnetospirillum sp. SS-4]
MNAIASLHPILGNDHRVRWQEERLRMEGLPNLRFTPAGIRRARVSGLIHGLQGLFGWGVKALGLSKRATANMLDIQVTEHVLHCSALPVEFDDYSILHVSDPHFDAHPSLGPAIIAAAGATKPDLLVLTGDYRFGESGPFDLVETCMATLAARVRPRDGAWAVLGNHDTADMVPAFERHGIQCLINETMVIRRGKARLVVTGLDDVHRYYTPDAKAALDLEGHTRTNRFGLALVHSPDMAPEAAERGYDLYLCGHTHGGQICLPGGKAVMSHRPVRLGHDTTGWVKGRWTVGAMQGITSRGAGVSGIPVRFNAPPEIGIIRLKPVLGS